MNLETLKAIEKKQAKRIADYLLERIETDQCLKEKLETTNKTLKGCIEYVKSEARKQAEDGMAWITDEEVWEWVVHYFLEDELDYEPKPPVEKKSKKKGNKKSKDTDIDEEEDEEEPKKEPKIVNTLFGEEVIEDKPKTHKGGNKDSKKEIKEKLDKQLSLFDL